MTMSSAEKTDVTRTLDAIEARRSVRKFDAGRTVEDDVMRRIVECGMCSPTAVNSREWHFVVVRDAATRERLAGAVPYCRFAAEPTAVCVVVCAELAKEKAPGHWPQDCGAAVQTMLIAAAALGVGSTWTSLHPFEDVCASLFPSPFSVFDSQLPSPFISTLTQRAKNVGSVLGVPEGVEPFALVVFGYPPADKPLERRPSRFDAALLHNEKW